MLKPIFILTSLCLGLSFLNAQAPTNACPLAPPLTFTYTNLTGTSVDLVWSSVGFGAWYKVDVFDIYGLVQTSFVSTTTLTVNGLFPGFGYIARVSASRCPNGPFGLYRQIRFTTSYGGDNPLPSFAGLTEFSEPAKSVLAFPNPFDNRFSLSLSNLTSNEVSVRIVNMLGQTVYTADFNEMPAAQLEILSDAWSAGSYVVTVKAGDQYLSEKLVKH